MPATAHTGPPGGLEPARQNADFRIARGAATQETATVSR